MTANGAFDDGLETTGLENAGLEATGPLAGVRVVDVTINLLGSAVGTTEDLSECPDR